MRDVALTFLGINGFDIEDEQMAALFERLRPHKETLLVIAEIGWH